MPLWIDEPFALDTEDDEYVDGIRKTRLVQLCPISATSLDDTIVLYGWDAWNQFFDKLEDTKTKKHLKCHCFNLGGYEFSHMLKEVLLDRYTYTDEKSLGKGEWALVADDQTVYKVTVRGENGTILEFTDDMRRMGNTSMEKASKAVKREHPEWFIGMDETKLETDYHAGWLDESDPDFESSMEYSKQDVYSQAMIARWLHVNAFDTKLTAPAIGLRMALAVTYCDKELSECSMGELKYAEKRFTELYPPLSREMQDIAERSLLGGFVWGETGTWNGTFCHADYSSSYPYEYVYGNMFIGRVSRIGADDEFWDKYMTSDMMKWFVVSFDFKLKDGMLGCISGRECVTDETPMNGRYNKKMISGKVKHRLYTESYLKELGEHYELSNMVYDEMWVAKAKIGGFEQFITKCYETKNELKRMGLGKSAGYLIWKLFMNGGFHGKSITKTNRRRRTFIGGVQAYVKETNDPKLCFMLGFTAMMNARERLLRHCRMVLESGHRVMMCDTDSMVVDCPADELREIIGDWFVKDDSNALADNLGRFEIETDDNGKENFDTFKCWGLKRYCEIDNGTFRKSAFAGMHDEMQKQLMDWETDGTEYSWMQKGHKDMKYGAVVLNVTKKAKAECIWDCGSAPMPKSKKCDLSKIKEIYEFNKDVM